MLWPWVTFLILAFLTLFTAIMVVVRRNPIHSALFLVANFFLIAVLYLLLGSSFIAIAQVMIYAGAIMMLIIFTIMLISVEETERASPLRFSPVKVFGIVITSLLFLELVVGVGQKVLPGKLGSFTPERIRALGNVQTVGGLLMGKDLLPFEVASVILLVGIIGAVILAKRER